MGYRVRMDAKVSRDTRVEVVTDGILLRRLQVHTSPSIAYAICVNMFTY